MSAIAAMIACFQRGTAPGITGSGGSITLSGNGAASYSAGGTGVNRWFIPGPGGTTGTSDSVGIGTNYWIRTTKVSGVGNPIPTAGVWTNITASGVALANNGASGAMTMTVDFSRFPTGAVIEGSGDVTVNNSV